MRVCASIEFPGSTNSSDAIGDITAIKFQRSGVLLAEVSNRMDCPMGGMGILAM
jgi:hypothetical protein